MDEIPTYNHSKPDTEEEIDLEARNSFYHKAAKISFFAPLLGGIFLKSIEHSLHDNKASWVQFAEFGILGLASLIAIASIILAIVALFGISTYGTAGILWRSLRGILVSLTLMWFLGVTVVQDYMKKRSEQLLAAVTKATSQAKELTQKEIAEKEAAEKDAASKAQATQDKTKGGSTTPAKPLTADEAVLAKAMGLYTDKAQAFQKAFDDSANFMKTARVLDMKSVTRKENMVPRKAAVDRFLEANEKLTGFVNRGETGFRECLVRASATAATIDIGLRNYRSTMSDRNFVTMKVRMTDQRIGTAMLGMLTILDVNWGNWKYDQEKKQVIFNDPATLGTYLELYKEMNAASGEQTQLLAELEKYPDTAAVK